MPRRYFSGLGEGGGGGRGRGGGGRGRGGGGRGRGRGGGGRGRERGEETGGWTQQESAGGGRGAGGGGARPPPGLRGRDIGLFYRDRARRGGAKAGGKKEFVMTLNIPAAVVRRVERLLREIMSKRSDEVSIAGVKRIPKDMIWKEMERDSDGNVYKIERPDSPFAMEGDTETKIKDYDKSDVKQCTSSDFMLKNENENDDVLIVDNWEDIETESPIVIDDGNDNDSDEDKDDDCMYMGTAPVPRVKPLYLEDPENQPKKPPPVIIKKDKVEPETVQSDEFIRIKQNVKSSNRKSIIENESILIKQSSNIAVHEKDQTKSGQRWTNYDEESETLNSEALKKEEPISVLDITTGQSKYTPLPLNHAGSQYKYGYYDIITGSFMEKLEECLSKGTGVQATTSDIDRLSGDYLQDFIIKTNSRKYKSMMVFREKLPAYKKREELLEQINNSQVIVISGETGCGKSTQVPQIILDDAILSNRGGNVKIVVTQPRRIAASSLAKRVSEERAERLGESVGYAVRLDRVMARSRGSITFCTTGVLLADLETNQGLTEVSHIILDEVHERDCNVDLAMCMLKQVIRKRKDLKLILMSATLDAESLSAYFDNCPTLHIEGLAYPVQDIFMEDILKMTGFTFDEKEQRGYTRNRMSDQEKDIQYKMEVGPLLERRRHELGEKVFQTLLDRRIEELDIDLIFELLVYICRGPPGAVLIFLPGMTDITKLLRLIEGSTHFPRNRYNIYPLHSKLSSIEQHKIFDTPPEGVRKVVIATNIAETSITIDDVVYVIDSAKIKITGLNIKDNVSTLGIVWVSQANLRQRRGRAGRVQPGICYHLITSARAEQLDQRLLPELQRSSLLEPVLAIKRLRLGRAAVALQMVPDPPAMESVESAVKHLKQLGALDDSETLTPLGWHLARLPVHPAAGKLLLFGALFGCLDRAASVAASWGFKDPFVIAIGKEKLADAARSRLANGEPSDHVAISEAVLQWETRRDRYQFAHENFLSVNTLQLLCDMKNQFAGNLKAMGFLSSGDIRAAWENRNANNLSIFKAVVAASLYPQIGTVRWIGLHRPTPRIVCRTPEDGRVEIHPSSVLAQPPGGPPKRICSNPGASWFAYWMKQKSMKLYLFDVSLVHTMPLMFFGELNVTDDPTNRHDCFISISSIKVRCNKTTAQLLVQLKTLLDEVLASRVAAPGSVIMHGDFEENVLNAVIELITAEDEQNDYEDDDEDSDRSY